MSWMRMQNKTTKTETSRKTQESNNLLRTKKY